MVQRNGKYMMSFVKLTNRPILFDIMIIHFRVVKTLEKELYDRCIPPSTIQITLVKLPSYKHEQLKERNGGQEVDRLSVVFDWWRDIAFCPSSSDS